MKELLRKECTLTALPMTYLFLLFALMTLVPGYPIAVGGFFFCLGLFQTTLSAREQHDLLFTLLLPVRKTDVVAAKYRFAFLMELAYLLLCALLTAVRSLFWADASVYRENAMMNANPIYLAVLCLLFAGFNGIFLGGFWKTAYRVGGPFVRFAVYAFLLIAAAETLHHLPGLAFLNTPWERPGVQLAVLAGCAAVWIAGTVQSEKRAARRFDRLDFSE